MKKKSIKASKKETVFIRANDAATLKLIDEVKKATGCNVATKAFLRAVSIYMKQINTIATLEKDLQSTKSQLRQADELLQRLHASNTSLAAYSKKFLSGKYPSPEMF